MFEGFESFALLALSFGQAKILVQGDIEAYEVEEYLERNGVKSDCWAFSEGVVVAVAGADEPRARALLEAW